MGLRPGDHGVQLREEVREAWSCRTGAASDRRPVVLDPPTGAAAMRLWDATTAWLEFPYLFELQRPKNAMYGAVIADRLRPYLDARDWVSIDRGRVVPIR